MTNSLLSEYIKKKFCRSNVKTFCDYIIKKYKQDSNNNIVSLFVVNFPFLANGYTFAYRWSGRYVFTICININPFQKDNDMPIYMKWFYTYVTLLHEIKHIGLVTKHDLHNDYSTYLAVMDNTSEIGKYFLFSKMLYWLMPGHLKGKKKYDTSSNEMLCKYESIKNAYQVFSIYMEENERKAVLKTIEAIRFILDNLEIGYSYDGIPFNKFTRSIIRGQRLIKKDKNAFAIFPQLSYIFTPNGDLKSLTHIYQDRCVENEDLIDNIIIHILINIDIDYFSTIKENKSLKSYIEYLANQYCDKVLDYFDNIEIGEILVDREVLDENATILFKCIRNINKLMEICDMERSGGNVLLLE